MTKRNIAASVRSRLLNRALLFDLWFDIPHRPTRDAESDLNQFIHKIEESMNRQGKQS